MEYPKALTELRAILEGQLKLELDLWVYEEFNWTYKPSDWTRNPKSDETLFSFAKDGVGGQALIWMREGAKPGRDNPVAFLGRDGEVAVIAATFAEFAALLAAGISPYSVASDSIPEEVSAVPLVEDWRAHHFGQNHHSIAEILERGRALLPEFRALVESQRKKR
jgi:hypothetical protein